MPVQLPTNRTRSSSSNTSSPDVIADAIFGKPGPAAARRSSNASSPSAAGPAGAMHQRGPVRINTPVFPVPFNELIPMPLIQGMDSLGVSADAAQQQQNLRAAGKVFLQHFRSDLSVNRRPFWVLKQLSRVMLDGGYLCPDLYLPVELWGMTGVRLPYMQEKINFLQQIAQNLLELAHIDTNNPTTMANELGAFFSKGQQSLGDLTRFIPKSSIRAAANSKTVLGEDNGTDEIDASQQFAMAVQPPQPVAPPPAPSAAKKIGATLTGLFGSTAKSVVKSVSGLVNTLNSGKQQRDEEELKSYMAWLLQVCDKAQFLDNWVRVFVEGPKANSTSIEVKHLLELVAYFFLQIIQSFVFHDIALLLEKYLKKCAKAVGKLFPPNYKLSQEKVYGAAFTVPVFVSSPGSAASTSTPGSAVSSPGHTSFK